MNKTYFKYLICIFLIASCDKEEMIDNELSDFINSELKLLDADNSTQDLMNLYENAEIIIFGESHYVQEFQNFYVSQLGYLSQSGYRFVHNELFHCFSWMVDDYVKGVRDSLPEFILYFDETNLAGIRKFNDTVPDSLKFTYKYFDLNHWSSNFLMCVDEIEKIIGEQSLFSEIKSSEADSEIYSTNLNGLEDALVNEKDNLILNWGEEWFNRIVEIVNVEIESLDFRKNRSIELREELMFNNVKNDIQNVNNGKDLVITGLKHASKSLINNNDIEPLGMRIENTNENISSLFFTGFKGIRKQRFNDQNNISFNLIESSDHDDVIIEIHKKNSIDMTFLPLDNNYFKERVVKISSLSGKYNTQIGLRFDGIVIIPEISVLKSMSIYDWM